MYRAGARHLILGGHVGACRPRGTGSLSDRDVKTNVDKYELLEEGPYVGQTPRDSEETAMIRKVLMGGGGIVAGGALPRGLEIGNVHGDGWYGMDHL